MESLLGVDAPIEDAREYLDRAEFGILGLTDGSEVYTIPLSFGYDSDLTTLYFLLAFAEDSKKREFLKMTDIASFTVAESNVPDEWASVVFTGPIEPVPEGEEQSAYASLAETAEFPAGYTFQEYFDMSEFELSLYRFNVHNKSFRKAPANPAE